ncbi:glycosyltransferase WbuB [Clostridium polyendosporum]|uniref:Glycosyltransferase WbuB n=1 Tax=Clostridium polyendosporum TaxID=69208 RepID=A0A919VFC9_9CLOT|nr:glycosyltransferase family 4 protein [Clostridium polyendosporum]GIM27376.1 glycosyltransferase WbuB [Clostridium polyendosporum]
MKKKLLIYAHYYYPDVASTAQILTELTEGLASEFNITVICVVPSYEGKVEEFYKGKRFYYESYKDISVIRVRVPEFSKGNKISRIKNIMAYFINALLATFKLGKQDYVLTISQPPILGGILGVIGSILKRAKLIYNIQDFNPEQTEAIGYSKSKIILKLAKKIDCISCKRASKIILVGRDMEETLKKRFSKNRLKDVTIINNWVDENEIFPLSKDNIEVIKFKKKHNLLHKIVIMYSGNLGLYYDLENIIKVAERFKNNHNVVFTFVGSGSIRDKLISYVNDKQLNNVVFIPYQEKENLNYSLNAADIHLVINAKGIKGVSVPSKLYGVMAAGKGIVGVLEEGSEARSIIEEAKCGLCIEPGDYDGVYNTLLKIIEGKVNIKEMGVSGRIFLEEHLKKEHSITRYKEAILKV